MCFSSVIILFKLQSLYSAFDFCSFVLLLPCSSVSAQGATECVDTMVYSETDGGHAEIVLLLILSRKLHEYGVSLLH